MLLVIDVGNTNITLGVFEKEKLEATFRMTAKQPRTSDEYGIKLCTLLEHRGFDIEEIDAVIVCRRLCRTLCTPLGARSLSISI